MFSYFMPTLQKKEKVRYEWFLSFLMQAILVPLIGLIDKKSIFFNALQGDISQTNFPELPLWILLVPAVTVLFLIEYCIYYCGYKKYGTKLLQCLFIINPLLFILFVLPRNYHCIGLAWCAMYFIKAYFWLQCYRLYKINKALKQAKS